MLSSNLKKARQSKGLTQSELGKIVGAIHATISNYETGRVIPDGEMLMKLSEALSISVNELMGKSSQKEENSNSLSQYLDIIQDSSQVIKSQQELLREMQKNVTRLIDMIK